jgi:acetyl-CoA/propionyl-CoA carboxylase biotin carboxyl carrier protein
VAAGEPLPFDADSAPSMNGHAIEARVYAEDPSRGFLPTGGVVLAVRSPAGAGVRVDSALAPGVAVTSDYDPMLAKVAAWGPDRATALRRLDAALASTVVLGVGTNVAFLRGLLRDPDVQAGHLDTGLVERRTAFLNDAGGHGADGEPLSLALAAAALARVLAREPAGPVTDPWDIPDGWRPGERAWTKFRLSHGAGTAVEVRVRGLASAGAEVAVGDGEPVAARASLSPASGPGGDGAPSGGFAGHGAAAGDRRHGTDLVLTYGGRTVRFAYAADADRASGTLTWLGRDGHAWAVRDEPPTALRGARAGTADGTVRSPMPGTVLAVHVTVGDVVSTGQPVLMVEAMKMEHTVTAPMDGTVTELTAKAGQQVRMDETLAVIGSIAQKATIEAAESANEPVWPGGESDGSGERCLATSSMTSTRTCARASRSSPGASSRR